MKSNKIVFFCWLWRLNKRFCHHCSALKQCSDFRVFRAHNKVVLETCHLSKNWSTLSMLEKFREYASSNWWNQTMQSATHLSWNFIFQYFKVESLSQFISSSTSPTETTLSSKILAAGGEEAEEDGRGWGWKWKCSSSATSSSITLYLPPIIRVPGGNPSMMALLSST